MTDLYLGLGIMTALMGVMFVLARMVTRRVPKWVVDGLAGLVVILIAVYARWVWDDTFVAQLLPFSNLIIVSNWFPMAAGFLAGLVWQRIGDQPAKFLGLGKGEYGSTPRKILAVSVLFVAGDLSAALPLFGRAPECESVWEGNLCFQTTDATCSAAAGATLLQQYGIYASEQEMARLCLTKEGTHWNGLQLTRRGTNWKGLYRALTIKGREAGRSVEVTQSSIDSLIDSFTGPVILQCELLLENQAGNGRYDMRGWIRGQSHSVVLLDVYRQEQDVLFIIADPSLKATVYEVWTRKDLSTLWHGQAVRLVSTDDPTTGDTE